MKKIIVFLGDSGSGKTTLIAELTQRFPTKFSRIVTCTSREMRPGEQRGIDYHFLPESYFLRNTELILVKRMDDGTFYGTRRNDLKDSSRHLLLSSRASGVRRLQDEGFTNIHVVRIAISDELKTVRLRARGDGEEAIARRRDIDTLYSQAVDWKSVPVLELSAEQDLTDWVSAVVIYADR